MQPPTFPRTASSCYVRTRLPWPRLASLFHRIDYSGLCRSRYTRRSPHARGRFRRRSSALSVGWRLFAVAVAVVVVVVAERWLPLRLWLPGKRAVAAAVAAVVFAAVRGVERSSGAACR